MSVFVDREKELKLLMEYVRNRLFVLVYGLRGVGKSAILRELARRLMASGEKVLYVDGLLITCTEDMAKLVGCEERDPRGVLSALLSLDDHVIIVDEFLYVFRALMNRRVLPSLEAIATYLRGLLVRRRERGGKSVILCSSSIGVVEKLTRDYFAPLFREMKVVLVEPLDMESAIRLAMSMGVGKKDAMEIVSLVGGMPLYVIKMCEEVKSGLTPREALRKLLTEPTGDLNIYFTALYEKLTPEERLIVHLLARGITRYARLRERTHREPTVYLRKLMMEGLVIKVKKGPKDSHYVLKDRVFAAWLQLQEIPSLGRISFETVIVSSLAFEALVRDLLRMVTREIRITDALGRTVLVRPAREVVKWSRGGVDVDALVIEHDSIVVVEAHFWGAAGRDKVEQALRCSEVVRKYFSLPVRDVWVVSYFGFSEDAIERARETGVKLLSARELREIQRYTGIYLGF